MQRRHHRGFTLIEILVVLVIIAIVISFAMLSIGVTGRDAALDEESRRLEGLLGLLHERAVLEGRDFGLLLEPATYQFVVYQSRRDRWEKFDEEREFRRRELPAGLSFEIDIGFSRGRVEGAERTHQIRCTVDRATIDRCGQRRRYAVQIDAGARRVDESCLGQYRLTGQDHGRNLR